MITKVTLWSSERDKQLLELINEGQTFMAAGLALGVTRSAVAGRYKRLTKPSTTPRAMVGAKQPRVAVAPLQKPLNLLKPISLKLSLMDLPSTGCKYATSSHGPQHLFCGAPQHENSPYCTYHKNRTTDLSRMRPR